MRQRVGCVGVLVTGLIASWGGTGRAQIVKRPKPVPEKSACSYVTKAEAEAVVGGALEPGVADAKARSCRYLEAGYGVDAAKKKQVSITVARSYFQNASDVSIRWGTIADDHSLSPIVTREVPGYADAALWVWAGGYLGVLYAFKGGTTEVSVKISEASEQAALAAAKRIAARALGGAGGSGYQYAPPEVTMTAKEYFMPEILRPLYEGEFERVRDNEQARRYVMALMQGLNASCAGVAGGMPEEMAVVEYGFHSAWNAGLKAEAVKDFDGVFAGQMERLKKSSPEILREGNADAVRFVKENGEKSGCRTAPVEHLYQEIVNLAGERRRVLPTDWR